MKRFGPTLFIIFIGFTGCGSSPSPAERANDSLIKICSAGLSSSTSAQISAIVAGNGGSFGGGVDSEIQGAIFADPTIQSADRVRIFQDYLNCIQNPPAGEQPQDAQDAVQNVVDTNDWSAAGMFSGYDWAAKFQRTYQNVGTDAVECSLRIRGVLERRADDSIERIGRDKEFTFRIDPGKTNQVSGKVGAYGFNTASDVVTVDDDLQCWNASWVCSSGVR
jgi:hypothetical protein